ncbi:hypothetical protein EDC96DRAFT_546406 [Choanephora cucurbitarum]|nr:hypothetical protein EDC96DRAFT_546406 [Choanephora cucurbitarum]
MTWYIIIIGWLHRPYKIKAEDEIWLQTSFYKGDQSFHFEFPLIESLSLQISQHQKFDNISNKSIRDIVARFIPGVTTVPMSTFSQWLNDLLSAARLTKRKRTNDKQMLVRSMWFLVPERQGQVAANLFNKHMFIESVKTGECKTIGYARKSHTNESKSVRLRLLEDMTAILVDPCQCSKVYVTPICAANSPLLERDLERSTLSKEIRHAYGDMQDLIAYAKTAVHPIRLVVIDYAGLTTSPQDLFGFISSLPMICSLSYIMATGLSLFPGKPC